nr:hypothetical protein [Microcoleus asticus]
MILSSVIEHSETLKNVASDFRLSHAEVVVAADRLFQKGYILAGFRTEDGEFIKYLTLDRAQIQAHLDGKFTTFYYLTPQGRALWETLSHPDTELELDTNPSNLFGDEDLNYYATLAKTLNPKVEYLILEFAVIFSYYGLRNVAYSMHLSHAETALAADSLFQRGDIKATVFADEYDDYHTDGNSDVILTRAGIQDHLDGRLLASYYLTPQGGARWEAMAHPDWNKFSIVNFLGQFPYEEGFLGTQREIIEQLLALDRLLFMYKHIPGSEKWNVLEPWEATYWKTLPRGYYVSCEFQHSDFFTWKLDDNTPAEIVEEYKQASQWYENVKKWYTDPSFD